MAIGWIIRNGVWLRAVSSDAEYWCQLSDDVIKTVVTVNTQTGQCGVDVVFCQLVVDGTNVIGRHSCRIKTCPKCRLGRGNKCFEYGRERVLGLYAFEGPMLTYLSRKRTVLWRNDLDRFPLQAEHVRFVCRIALDFGDVNVASVWEKCAHGALDQASVR